MGCDSSAAPALNGGVQAESNTRRCLVYTRERRLAASHLFFFFFPLTFSPLLLPLYESALFHPLALILLWRIQTQLTHPHQANHQGWRPSRALSLAAAAVPRHPNRRPSKYGSSWTSAQRQARARSLPFTIHSRRRRRLSSSASSRGSTPSASTR